MEGVTVFCELLKNPQRRHLADSLVLGDSDSADANSTSTDEDTDSVAMSSPTGASASSADGTEDFASAFGFDDESEVFTLFVPSDTAFAEIADAFETLSDAEAGRVIMFHMYSGMLLTSEKLACSETITSMNEMSDASRTKCKNDGKKYQNGNGNTKTGSMPEIDTADHMACNGVIHTLDHVMFPVSLAQLHADDADAASSDASDSSDPTTTTGESSDSSSDAEIDYMACPVDKHGCYCCAAEYDYPAGAASCRTDHHERYCCGAEDQCSEEAVHPNNSGDSSHSISTAASTTGASTSEDDSDKDTASSTDTADASDTSDFGVDMSGCIDSDCDTVSGDISVDA